MYIYNYEGFICCLDIYSDSVQGIYFQVKYLVIQMNSTGN